LCGYCPVRKPARDGQHSGLETKLRVKRVPASARWRKVFGIVSRLSWATFWSSVMTTITFGRGWGGDASPAGAAGGVAATRPSAPAAAARIVAARSERCGADRCWRSSMRVPGEVGGEIPSMRALPLVGG
jgi:hypothetical protein